MSNAPIFDSRLVCLEWLNVYLPCWKHLYYFQDWIFINNNIYIIGFIVAVSEYYYYCFKTVRLQKLWVYNSNFEIFFFHLMNELNKINRVGGACLFVVLTKIWMAIFNSDTSEKNCKFVLIIVRFPFLIKHYIILHFFYIWKLNLLL